MPFYYLLHHALPETEAWRGGKRNCGTFMIGSTCYAVAYGVLCWLEQAHGRAAEAARRTLVLVWMADAATMAYTYKAYYGRTILHEIAPSHARHVFDERTHTYRAPSEAERLQAGLQEADAVAGVLARRAAEQEARARGERAAAVARSKERARAARVVQRWWRARLYNPPHGIFYRRAADEFARLAAAQAPPPGVEPAA